MPRHTYDEIDVWVAQGRRHFRVIVVASNKHEAPVELQADKLDELVRRQLGWSSALAVAEGFAAGLARDGEASLVRVLRYDNNTEVARFREG